MVFVGVKMEYIVIFLVGFLLFLYFERKNLLRLRRGKMNKQTMARIFVILIVLIFLLSTISALFLWG